MSRPDSYFACRPGRASVERFLLARQERQMTADARGYMGAHWHLPFEGGLVFAAIDSSREQSEVEGEGAEASADTDEEE